MSRSWLLFVALALGFAAHSALLRSPGDFAAYYTATQRVWAGERVYRVEDGAPYKYSPPTLLVFAPLGKLPLRAAKGVVVFFSALGLLWVAGWSRRATGAPQASHLVVLLVAPYALQEFSYGQVDLILLWLAAASEETAERHPWRSGALLAAAALVKAPYLILLAPALLFRQWRRLAGVGAGLAAAVALTLVAFRSLTPFSEWSALMAASTTELIFSQSNESLMAMVSTFAAPGSRLFDLVVGGVALSLVALWCAVMLRERDPARARFAGACGGLYLCAFLSPLGWWCNLVGLLPLLYALTTRVTSGARATRVAAAAALGVGALAAFFTHHLLGYGPMEWVRPWHHYGVAALVVAVTWAVLSLWPLPAAEALPAALPAGS